MVNMMTREVHALNWRRACLKALNVTEGRFRVDMNGLELYFNGVGTMKKGQREHVVQFITEVCI